MPAPKSSPTAIFKLTCVPRLSTSPSYSSWLTKLAASSQNAEALRLASKQQVNQEYEALLRAVLGKRPDDFRRNMKVVRRKPALERRAADEL